jgi:H+/Cl- antiporter ClcA
MFRLAESFFFRMVEWNPYSPLVASPVLFVLAWFIVKKYAPEAAGSGIPQIMAANEIADTIENRPFINRLLSVKTAMIKIASSLLCLLGGGAIGREGPTLQISTSLFHFVGKHTNRFIPGINSKTWIVAGAASGLASAFNTPLGGIVYAIEELGLVHFHKIRTALLSGVIISGLMAQWLLGSYLYLGFPPLQEITFSFLPVALLTGLITGLLGALFGKILITLARWRLSFKKFSHLAAITALTGVLMAVLTVYDRRAAGPGIELVTAYLFKGDHADLSLAAVRYGATMISYLSGAAGGIFSPSLAIGGTIGSALTILLNTDHPTLMVLLGMIGFLTGVTRTPFTSFILVLLSSGRKQN